MFHFTVELLKISIFSLAFIPTQGRDLFHSLLSLVHELYQMPSIFTKTRISGNVFLQSILLNRGTSSNDGS